MALRFMAVAIGAALCVAVANAAVNPENVSWAPTSPIPDAVRARTKAMRASFTNATGRSHIRSQCVIAHTLHVLLHTELGRWRRWYEINTGVGMHVASSQAWVAR